MAAMAYSSRQLPMTPTAPQWPSIIITFIVHDKDRQHHNILQSSLCLRQDSPRESSYTSSAVQ